MIGAVGPDEGSAADTGRSVAASCRAGRHVPARGVTIDAAGVAHGRCRRCGCALRRLPAIRRWFVSGMMG